MDAPSSALTSSRPTGYRPSWTNIAFLCGVVLLVAGLAYLWMISAYITKVDRVAREISENPAKDAAQIIARENPDWVILSADNKTGEIVFRNKKSGEEAVISYQNGTSGNFSVKGTDGSKMEMHGGKIEISNAKGEKTIMGAGETVPPAWIPSYPHVARRDVILSSVKEGRLSGSLSFQTEDGPVQVKDYYTQALKITGWKVTGSTQIGTEAANLVVLKMENGSGNTRQTFNVMASRKEEADNSTNVQVIWEGTKEK